MKFTLTLTLIPNRDNFIRLDMPIIRWGIISFKASAIIVIGKSILIIFLFISFISVGLNINFKNFIFHCFIIVKIAKISFGAINTEIITL